MITLSSCNSEKILRKTFTEPKMQNPIENQILLLHLTPNHSKQRELWIKSDRNILIYKHTNSAEFFKDFLELNIPKNSHFLIGEFEKVRFRIKLDKNYKFVYVEPRENIIIDIVYPNKKPIFTD